MKPFFHQYGVFVAWIVSVTATLTSLYFSQIAHLVPCSLCWYQRICMYPLAIILGVATYREDRTIFIYSGPLTVIGASISLFQYLEQQIPFLRSIIPCSIDAPCTVDYLNLFGGFVTIPLLSLISFLMILLFVVLAYTNGHQDVG